MQTFMTCSEAYLATLHDLTYRAERTVSPRGQPCREIMDCMFRVARPSALSIMTHSEKRNQKIAAYQKAEFDLYSIGETRACVWATKASRFWAALANPDGTINSNYGQLMFYEKSLPDDRTPLEWVVETLSRDPESRQAYMPVALPRHLCHGTRDQVCTLHMMFLIRDGTLHGSIVMRSNDVVRGLVYDMPWFVFVLQEVARLLDRRVGTYTHHAHSMHLYERDVPLAMEMLGC